MGTTDAVEGLARLNGDFLSGTHDTIGTQPYTLILGGIAVCCLFFSLGLFLNFYLEVFLCFFFDDSLNLLFDFRLDIWRINRLFSNPYKRLLRNRLNPSSSVLRLIPDRLRHAFPRLRLCLSHNLSLQRLAQLPNRPLILPRLPWNFVRFHIPPIPLVAPWLMVWETHRASWSMCLMPRHRGSLLLLFLAHHSAPSPSQLTSCKRLGKSISTSILRKGPCALPCPMPYRSWPATMRSTM